MGRGSTILGSLRVVAVARRSAGRGCARLSRDGWREACGTRRPAARGIGGSEA